MAAEKGLRAGATFRIVPSVPVPDRPSVEVVGPTIDLNLVRRLVDGEFPQWSRLPLRPVDVSGVDNRTFRLGTGLSVRLPSAQRYALQVEKEQRWLPVLAPQLPLPIPAPVALGHPAHGYPWAWSIYRWLDGSPAGSAPIDDLTDFAIGLAEFLRALQRIETHNGPAPGPHNFYRGAAVTVYADEVMAAVDALAGVVPRATVLGVWQQAVASSSSAAPVWFHGDVAGGNLLVRDGRLAAVIDFGGCGVGDPACDLVIAWTMLQGPSRAAFRARLDVDDAMWARARGWALWKSLITMAGDVQRGRAPDGPSKRVLDEVVADA